jgi:enoyl-[acyl-carrier-protein] reductase (NADH)
MDQTCARALADHGQLLRRDVGDDQLKVVCTDLRTEGARVETLRCEVTSADQAAEIAEQPASRVPLRRIAEPWEVVGNAVLLASEASASMTGALLGLDGGTG